MVFLNTCYTHQPQMIPVVYSIFIETEINEK